MIEYNYNMDNIEEIGCIESWFDYNTISTVADIESRLKYDDVRENRKNVLHLGQLKLLISEICFLTKYIDMKNITVVYVGAAEGYHILKLSEMFPEMKFKLYDPQRFTIVDTERITIYNKFFTEDDALSYSKMGSNILFISDIRNVPSKNPKEVGIDYELEDAVIGDMKMQMDWIKIIQPLAASLKFRLPYDGETLKYCDGYRMLQSYAPFSTEVRLFTSTYNTLIEYQCKEFDEKMAYFNNEIRTKYISSRWMDIMRMRHIVNNWDSNFTMYVLHNYLQKIFGDDDDNAVADLFEEIADFLGSRYIWTKIQ